MTTNYERIKNMTVEEMAEFFKENLDGIFITNYELWLKQEAE